MTADFWIRFNKSSKRSALSGTGLVFGIGQIVVYPPFAAAMEPVAMVSLCSATRLTEMDMHIDKPRADEFPFGIYDFGIGFSIFSEILVIKPAEVLTLIKSEK